MKIGSFFRLPNEECFCLGHVRFHSQSLSLRRYKYYSISVFNKKKVEGEVDKVGGGPAAAAAGGAGGGFPPPVGGGGGGWWSGWPPPENL